MTTQPNQSLVAYVGETITPIATNYVPCMNRHLTTWHGEPIGTIRLVSSWRVESYIGSRMHQAYATVDGREYTGRTFGEGMSVVLRETAASKRKHAEGESR